MKALSIATVTQQYNTSQAYTHICSCNASEAPSRKHCPSSQSRSNTTPPRWLRRCASNRLSWHGKHHKACSRGCSSPVLHKLDRLASNRRPPHTYSQGGLGPIDQAWIPRVLNLLRHAIHLPNRRLRVNVIRPPGDSGLGPGGLVHSRMRRYASSMWPTAFAICIEPRGLQRFITDPFLAHGVQPHCKYIEHWSSRNLQGQHHTASMLIRWAWLSVRIGPGARSYQTSIGWKSPPLASTFRSCARCGQRSAETTAAIYLEMRGDAWGRSCLCPCLWKTSWETLGSVSDLVWRQCLLRWFARSRPADALHPSKMPMRRGHDAHCRTQVPLVPPKHRMQQGS